MFLAHVEIENYRGIRSLRLPIGPTTTLIGENAYGKSNLLDALLLCLGLGAAEGEFAFLPGDFRPADADGAHPAPGDEVSDGALPIEILLGFREAEEGEWANETYAPIRPYSYLSDRGERRITIVVRAELGPRPSAPPREAPRPISVRMAFLDARRREMAPPPPPEMIAFLRSRVPFIMLKADRYFVRPSRLPPPTDGDRMGNTGSRPARVEDRLAAEIIESYSHVSNLHKPIDETWIERGLEAAHTYLDRFGGERLKDRLSRFLNPRRAATGGTGVSGGARSIALLLLFGALIDVRADTLFGKGARPVLAIEDAEAYLHPVILASVAALIQAIPTQKLLTTNSGELLSLLPLPSVRRLVRRDDRIDVHRLRRDTLGDDELRRIGYHVRANRGGSLFARCWLLVEGETEFWLLPELAAALGHDFALEGVRCMEFAQCGVAPLVKLADDLGIGWHLLADGDRSGESYADAARGFLDGRPPQRHITQIPQRDIEHLLWRAGYADVYRSAIPSAAPRRFDRRPKVENPKPTIERALRARSKPGMALAVAEAARAANSPGVPEVLRVAIDHTVSLARERTA